MLSWHLLTNPIRVPIQARQDSGTFVPAVSLFSLPPVLKIFFLEWKRDALTHLLTHLLTQELTHETEV